METITTYAPYGVALYLNALAMSYLAQRFAEQLAPRLGLDFKPFKCGPCLTFWLTLATGLLISQLARNSVFYWVAGASVLIAFINYYIVKSKFRIYE